MVGIMFVCCCFQHLNSKGESKLSGKKVSGKAVSTKSSVSGGLNGGSSSASKLVARVGNSQSSDQDKM